jgi:hypothetical protein
MGETAAESESECVYCNAMISEDDCPDTVPAAGDDEAWEEIAKHHGDDCEWVRTRAHRR